MKGTLTTHPYRVKIAELCKQNNTTMTMLSAEMDVDKQTVFYWNQGRTTPKLSYLLYLSRRFKVSSLDDLIGDNPRYGQ